MISFAVAHDDNEDDVSSIDKIKLEAEGYHVEWEAEGNSPEGFKVVWSKNEDPTYPTREGDQYHYYTDPEKDSDTLEAFDGDGYYYVRVCEYVNGVCGVYSNQEKVLLGNESLDDDKEINDKEDDVEKDHNNESNVDEVENETELTSKNISEENVSEKSLSEDDCNFGCYVDSQCYPLGYRKNGEYCNYENVFVTQTLDDEECENNFECQSNLCVDNNCVSGTLVQKILSWFRKIFG